MLSHIIILIFLKYNYYLNRLDDFNQMTSSYNNYNNYSYLNRLKDNLLAKITLQKKKYLQKSIPEKPKTFKINLFFEYPTRSDTHFLDREEVHLLQWSGDCSCANSCGIVGFAENRVVHVFGSRSDSRRWPRGFRRVRKRFRKKNTDN